MEKVLVGEKTYKNLFNATCLLHPNFLAVVVII